MAKPSVEPRPAPGEAGEPRLGLTPPPPDLRGRGLGDVVVELGFAAPEPVGEAEGAARASGRTLEAVLLEQEVVGAEQLELATAAREGLPHVDLAHFRVEADAVAMLAPDDARHFGAQPVAHLPSGAVLVVMADPRDEQALSDLTFLIPHPVERALVGRGALDALIASRTAPEPPATVTLVPAPMPAPEAGASRAAPSALDQLQAALRTAEAEAEARVRGELGAAEAALRAELTEERAAHDALRRQLAAALEARADAERRLEVVREALADA